MADTMNLSLDELREMARTLRKDACMMTNAAKSGHTGGPVGMADYMAALMFNYLRVNPKDPYWTERDRMVISNGHTSALNFALLARRGFFSPGYLLSFRSTNSRLQGHPNHIKLPGVEIGAGSLGQGLSVAHGMALGAKLRGKNDVRVFCNLGDGEMQEGQIWEAIMHAGHRATNNLIVSVDYNNIQIDGFVSDIKRLDPLDDKFRDFHFDVRWADGHDMGDICDAWDWAVKPSGKPKAILFKTVMMKGIPEYENQAKWHGTPCNDEQLMVCLKALGYGYNSVEEARADYGEIAYDGIDQMIQASPWARVVHMGSLEITEGKHNEHGNNLAAPEFFEEIAWGK